MEPNEGSSLSPRRQERPIGAQELRAQVLGPPQTQPARAAGPPGHHRGRRGAAGPQATSLPAPFPGPRLSRLSEEKLGLDPGDWKKAAA